MPMNRTNTTARPVVIEAKVLVTVDVSDANHAMSYAEMNVATLEALDAVADVIASHAVNDGASVQVETSITPATVVCCAATRTADPEA